MHRDNQQQTANDLEIGWLAGILEGEGSICLTISMRNQRKQMLRVTPKIIFTNSDFELMESVIGILDKAGVGKWVKHTKPNNVSTLFKLNGKTTKKFKDMMYIYVTGMKRVKRLLDIVTPAMHGEKLERAIRLNQFIARRFEKSVESKKAYNYKYDQEDVDNMLHFLELTNTKRFDKISRMLNDCTGNKRVA